MGEAGILKEDDRVELIRGEIIAMSPIGSRHMACVNRLTGIFSAIPSSLFILSIQNPVHIGKYSEPEPDISLLKYSADFYEDDKPRSEDVVLVIEVAEFSFDYDVEIKIPLYAEAGIPEVWLIDLNENRVIVHTDPAEGSYQHAVEFRPGEKICSTTLPALIVDISRIFGL